MGAPLFWWRKMVALSYCRYLLLFFTSIQLWIHNWENKTLIWWPQLLEELTGGDGYKHRLQTIPVNTPVFPGSLPYFTPISRPPPVLLFLPGNSHNLYGPNLVIWIITSIFYSKVVQLPDLVWNASPNASPHTIDTIHKFQAICDLNLATYNPSSRRGRLNLASVVEMEGEESGGALAKKKIFV